MYTDILGNEISVGSWIAKGALNMRSGIIKIAYVLELFPENAGTTKRKFSTISFSYCYHNWSPNYGKLVIGDKIGHSQFGCRNLIIPKDLVPDYVQDSLADWLETSGLKYLEAMLEKKE